MIEQEYDKNEFTAEDLERYHTGKMTPQEMHLLEKAALDDPFLADALEGYALTPTPSHDVQLLKEKLNTRVETTKIIPLQKEKPLKQAWRIAALLILICGLGWAVYNFAFTDNEKNIAVSAPAIKESTTVDDSVAASSFTNGFTDSGVKTTNEELENKDIAASTPKIPTLKKEAANNNREEKLLTTNNRAGYYTPDANNNNTALSAPLSKDVNDATAESTTANKADSLQANSVTVAPSSAARQKEHIIVLQPVKDTSEVIVVKAQKKAKGNKPTITLEQVKPKDEDLDYDDYIADNIKLPKDEDFNTSRELRLSFDVNEAGQAINIQVEKSLCDECDKEAIRLLTQGPKLKKATKKRGKLSIRF